MKPVILLIWLIAGITAAGRAQQRAFPVHKLSPAAQQLKNRDKAADNRTFWIVTPHPEAVKQWLQQHKATAFITREYPATGLLVMTASWKWVDSLLLSTPLVQFIDVPRKPREEMALDLFDKSVNSISQTHYRLPWLNGEGLAVSIKEQKPDTTDIDFTGRYISTPLSAPGFTTHATVMATIAAGGGNSFHTGKGVAWGAAISSSSFASILPDNGADYLKYGISVQNHSYGTGIENYYGADAAAFDASVISNPFLLHVMSAGNSGNQASATGAYAGMEAVANLTGSFKMAKNIITVGATNRLYETALLSSRGPAYDGRIKPELAALGEDGSSGAAAITSGVSLLVQQAFATIHNGQLPPAALVKAVLLNSARDIGPPGPDFQSGFGSVNAYGAVNTVLSNNYYYDSLTTGILHTYPLSIPANIRQVKITLCWSDPPAVANASKALVNDLDLRLVNTADNTTWQPWVLNAWPHRDSLAQLPQRKRDSLNNVEQITIDDPGAGNYELKIQGYHVPNGTQPYAIAFQFDTANRFYWHFPTAADHLQSGSVNMLRWQSTYPPTVSGLLEYSTDSGSSWLPAGNTINISKGLYQWQAPDTFCSIHFRMIINGETSYSDTTLLSPPLTTKVGFNCTDSVLLTWNTIPGASGYIVYRLGEKYMEPFITTTDTAIIIQQPQQASPHYTIAPVWQQQTAGMKTYAFNYATQGVDCYIKYFLADREPPSSAGISFELGSLHGVQKVELEKLYRNGPAVLQNFPLGNSLRFLYTDQQLQKGGNTYRAAITLAGGARIYSQPATVFHFDNSGLLVFPNPVKAGSLLQVRSIDFEPKVLQLYNSAGHKVWEQTIQDIATDVPTTSLQRGVYFLAIFRNGQVVFKTPLLVQ